MPILNWLGKDKVINHNQQVPYRVLEAQYSFGQVESGNMIVHGDNLDALKALLPRYEGKVKCIYIDPPYNTGNKKNSSKKWVYSDNIDDPRIKKWIGQIVGQEGEDLVRHDKWLCMMYPRLKLLERLLSDGGVIFISIDNTELFSLKAICDEIFGATNFVTDIACVNNPKGRSDDKHIATAHEHMLIYKKGLIELGQFEPEEKVVRRYREIDEAGERYRTIDLRKTGDEDLRTDREDMFYPFFYCENSKELRVGEIDEPTPEGFIRVVPMKSKTVEGRWRWGKNDDSMHEGFCNLEARYMPQKRQWTIFERDYLKDKEGVKPTSAWTFKDVNSERGTESFVNLGFSKTDFPNPKPVGTIERVLKIAKDKNAIVLDSFAGSGTTAHAVLNTNKSDGGNRHFILVEMEDYADSITAERVKRVIDGYADSKKATEGTGGGFAYYELGDRLLLEDGNLNESLETEKIREYIWYTETRADYSCHEEQYLLGVRANTAYYFYYEKQHITVLDHGFLHGIKTKADSYMIYADINLLSAEEMDAASIRFKKIPRDIARI